MVRGGVIECWGTHDTHSRICCPGEFTFCRRVDFKSSGTSNSTRAADRLQATAVVFSSKIWMGAFYEFKRRGEPIKAADS